MDFDIFAARFSVDFDRFDDRFSNEPIIRKLVDRYDESGLVLKTHNMPSDTTDHETDPEHQTVKAMAKRALNKSKR